MLHPPKEGTEKAETKDETPEEGEEKSEKNKEKEETGNEPMDLLEASGKSKKK